MEMDLTLQQTRVIGCLIEKAITTPDQYPLSLNSLTTACNQKSNRDPIMSLSEADVLDLVEALTKKRFIREETGFGSRVSKYSHRFCNTEFSELQLTGQELGILCVLFLRGPQTPGELRTRTNRLCSFSDVQQVEQVLQTMSEREDYPLVVKLAREPGKRESRYAHLCSGPVAADTVVAVAEMPDSHAADEINLHQRVEQLEQRLAVLEARLDGLASD